MMPDKTSTGISDLLRQFIEALVEEVVLEGKPFDDKKKKWLQTYSQEEGVDYASLEKNLTDFFEVLEEWKKQKSKSSQLAAQMLATRCSLSEEAVEKLFSSPNENGVNLLDGHEYVDLGLPSGTLWATCNVGSKEPGFGGDHIAWGELQEKELFNENTYIHCDGNLNSMHEIGKNICGTQFDVAHVKWGGKWKMPTTDQFEELKEYCIFKFESDYYGFEVTSKINGNSIFLPTDGIGDDNNFVSGAIYWTGNVDGKYDAYGLNLPDDADYDDYIDIGGERRYLGGSIRPVIQGVAKEKRKQTKKKQITNEVGGHEYVDLGLPSGTLWATCNIGADTPEGYGDYFSWGGGDPATANWGEGWRMPTKEEWLELLKNTTNIWKNQNHVKGRLFTASNGNSIFLPAAGIQLNGEFRNIPKIAEYWSSSIDNSFRQGNVWFFLFNQDYVNGSSLGDGEKTIRAVCALRKY